MSATAVSPAAQQVQPVPEPPPSAPSRPEAQAPSRPKAAAQTRNPFDRAAPLRRPTHPENGALPGAPVGQAESAPRAPGAFRPGTLQRASADAAARLAAGESVDPQDLNDGRVLSRAEPFLVVTEELRAQRGWPAHAPGRPA